MQEASSGDQEQQRKADARALFIYGNKRQTERGRKLSQATGERQFAVGNVANLYNEKKEKEVKGWNTGTKVEKKHYRNTSEAIYSTKKPLAGSN